MDFFTKFDIKSFNSLLEPHHNILLIGSCFTEHMGLRLEKYGWNLLQNPTGVIYNPVSISTTLKRIVNNIWVKEEELYEFDGVYHHWDFHSRYSNVDKNVALDNMNASIQNAHEFLKNTDWLFLTWGSAHFYTFKETGYEVSNCHRVPNKKFDKNMYNISEMLSTLQETIQGVKKINPNIQICQTVSPVRHIKDGVVENSRSKARLIELSYLLESHGQMHYFPSYEILIDELRDYRFYDADLVHPNYAATQYVWEKLVKTLMSSDAQIYLDKMIELVDAYNHKPRFAQTEAHENFLKKYYDKCFILENEYPHLNLEKFKHYFSNQNNAS